MPILNLFLINPRSPCLQISVPKFTDMHEICLTKYGTVLPYASSASGPPGFLLPMHLFRCLFLIIHLPREPKLLKKTSEPSPLSKNSRNLTKPWMPFAFALALPLFFVRQIFQSKTGQFLQTKRNSCYLLFLFSYTISKSSYFFV